MNIVLISGSLRTDSYNTKLLRTIKAHLTEKNHSVNLLTLKDKNIPLIDEDLEESHFPESINEIGKIIAQADALIVSSPEYNGSISSVTKTLLDWVSRLEPMPLKEKHALIMAASPGALGGIRGLWHTRVPFEALGMHVYPEMFGLSKAHEMFADDGSFKDLKQQERLFLLVDRFVKHAIKQ